MISSSDYDELLSYGKKLLEKGNVVVEDYINGKHVTISILMDNEGYFILPICYEYVKRERPDKGTGVPTGGMGAICPLALEQNELDMLYKQIVHPTFKALKAEKLYYTGVLTFSTMLTNDGPYLVDYHVRLNDPATQAMVPIIKNDLCELMIAMKNNTLKYIQPETTGGSAVAVVIASEGYWRAYPMKHATTTMTSAPATLAPFFAKTSQMSTATPIGAYCMIPLTTIIMTSVRQSKI